MPVETQRAVAIPLLLRRSLGGNVAAKIYDRAKGQRMDIPATFENLPWNSHVYACGPWRMVDKAMREAKARGLGEDEVHLEAFGADTSGNPFEVEVTSARGTKKSSGKVLKMGEEEVLLEVLKNHFRDEDEPFSYEVANCEMCKVVLRSGRAWIIGARR
ncbi:hypothetical protein F4811DRAFT_7080 [Daldinia bambusicola]|nr:hypothetical protein F4811DRAFT_7080 [Daldinia bambusicola]